METLLSPLEQPAVLRPKCRDDSLRDDVGKRCLMQKAIRLYLLQTAALSRTKVRTFTKPSILWRLTVSPGQNFLHRFLHSFGVIDFMG
jgi:hypothetical protein